VRSTRAEGRGIGAVPRVDADLIIAAAALRWARPDLTAELADHVLEEAAAAGQQDRWLAAAGWAVHARAATGDGRETARGVLAALGRWGSDVLTGSAARRLRIELAMVAAGAGEVEFARRLLAGVQTDDGEPELTADLLCAHARCAVEDAPDEVPAALDAADAAWATVGGSSAQVGGASVALVRAVVERRAGRPAVAVDQAADGLARLERARIGSGTPSGHLAAALAAEWISALLDVGRVAEARDGCAALLPRLSEQARPTRQLALLRLTVTRALAAEDGGADTAELLAQAAEDAAGSDVPDLEAVCRMALGALHEQAERLDIALEALQLAVGAERRDRDRSRKFLAALAELPAEPEQPKRRRERAAASTVTRDEEPASASTDATTVLPAITRGDRKLRANRGEVPERGKSRFERLLEEPSPAEAEPAATEERSNAWDAVPWNGSAGDSPIGDLLIQSLRAGSAGPSGNGAARRNGKSRSAQAQGSGEPDTSSGWMPTPDKGQPGDEEPPARRRGRSADGDSRRSRRAREERDVTAAAPSRPTESARYRDDDSGEKDRSSRSRRRSRHGDDERAEGVGDRMVRGRHGRAGDLDEGGDAARSRAARSGGARRRREEDGPATEPSSSRSEELDVERAGAPEAGYRTSSGVADGSDDSDGWLQSALAELDRALSGIGVSGPPEIDDRPRSEERPQAEDGSAVVVDIARDGRRFAGPRAAAVVHAVADLLADRLPAGARSRFGDSDVLIVTQAGWSRADATDWMHRTLPGLLDGFVAAEELPGAQLRVAVHDADGPVGAQILQPLTPAGPERERVDDRRGDSASDLWADLTTTTSMSEARGQKYRAAARESLQERGSRGLREPDADPGGAVTPAEDSPRWPFSGEAEPSDPAPLGDAGRPARHGAERARPAGSARDEAGEKGRRHRADAQDRASGDEPRVKPAGAGGTRRRGSEKPPSTRPAGNGSAGSGSNGSGSNGSGSNGNGVANGAGPDAGGSGRRAKRDGGSAATATEQAPARATESEGSRRAADREPARAESTEGLGIADLLAGALAAYRGI